MSSGMHFLRSLEVQIKDDLRNSPELVSACISIIQYINTHKGNSHHITLYSLHQDNSTIELQTLIQATYYLASDHVKLLKQHYEALNSELGRYVEIPPEDVIQALHEKDFADPFTGEEIAEDQFKKMVIPFFSFDEEVSQQGS